MFEIPHISDEELEKLWQNLDDIPINPDKECLETPFLNWDAGTHREIIWHWFDQYYSKGVAFLMYGQPRHDFEEEVYEPQQKSHLETELGNQALEILGLGDGSFPKAVPLVRQAFAV